MTTQQTRLAGATAAESGGARPLPLAGIRVLDLGRMFNGPYAGYLLAHHGADVIKVEPLKGDTMRNRANDGDYPFKAINTCKRGITLNLKSDEGRRLLLDMVRKADVVLENNAPGFLPGLGLPPETFLEVNPRLVYASGSGYGRSGPYRDFIAMDLTIQAMSGMMSTTGELNGRPLKTGVPVIDILSGTHLYGAIVTALVERERTGQGRIVETSMLETVFHSLLPACGHVYEMGHPPRLVGNRHVADSYVPFDTFECKDGWMVIVCVTDTHWQRLVKAMGREDYAADRSLDGLMGRVARQDEICEAVTAWAKTGTKQEIVAALQEHGVPTAMIQDLQEVLNDPHLHARGFLEYVDSELGPMAFPHTAMRFHGSDLRPLSPAPAIGEHTDEVYAELLDLGDAELARLHADGVI